MDLDTNQPCPGGTGKKIRFCCKDLTRELDKIVRLMEGGQRKAAVEAADKALGSHGDRACLYALKAEAQAEAGDADGAKSTMVAFAEKFPDNSAALAEGAMAAMEDGRAAEAVDLLQSAVERSGETIDSRVYGAFGLLAQGLLLLGNMPAARAHLMMQADLSRGRDPAPLELLTRIDRAPQTPLLFKFSLDLEDQAPAGAAWQSELTQAIEKAHRGEWRNALAAMRALAERNPNVPVLRRNVALLASRLGDKEAAARAWSEYAALESVSWDDRVEAEAIAELLEPAGEEDELDEVKLTYSVADVERLTERLLSDSRMIAYEGDLSELVEENETPPKSAFHLLDRSEKQPEGAELTIDTVPNVLGALFLHGKRTDREARLEFEATRDDRLPAAQALLSEIGGDALGPVVSEEVTGKTSRVLATLSWQWRFPPHVPQERRRELMEEKRRQLIFTKWPEIPRAHLDGRTPRTAAGEGKLRARVAGAVLVLEQMGEQLKWGLDFNQLRQDLGLPRAEPIGAAGVDIRRLPLTRFSRLELEKLSDDDLAIAFHRAAAGYYIEALDRLAREVIRRGTLDEKVDLAGVHRILSQTSQTPEEALDHLRRCREIILKRGESPASLLLEEMRLRMLTGHGVEECNRLLQQIRSNHMNEPGVAQALYQTLVEFGVITPDGRPAAGRRPPGDTVAEAAAPADTAKLWTPNAPAPAPEKKSALWTPGMD
jgi:hypothetical protein